MGGKRMSAVNEKCYFAAPVLLSDNFSWMCPSATSQLCSRKAVTSFCEASQQVPSPLARDSIKLAVCVSISNVPTATALPRGASYPAEWIPLNDIDFLYKKKCCRCKQPRAWRLQYFLRGKENFSPGDKQPLSPGLTGAKISCAINPFFIES